MRVRDHVAVATAGAALLYPLFGRRVLGAWAGSILIDCDHYVWYAVRHRSLNPIGAVRFFNDGEAPHHPATKVLHSPIALSIAMLIGSRRRALLPVAAGMAMHVAMDTYHEIRMNRARTAALERDAFTCQACGSRGPGLTAHLHRQPRLLPSYRIENLTTLCPACHDTAHGRGAQNGAERGTGPMRVWARRRRGQTLPAAVVSTGRR
jgi:hypothetical protein